MRLPSLYRLADTDNDYMPDIDEMTASIWRGQVTSSAIPTATASSTGKTHTPSSISKGLSRRPFFVPIIDGKIEGTWQVLSNGYFWSADEVKNLTIYAAWDEKNLYLSTRSNKKLDLWLGLQLSTGYGKVRFTRSFRVGDDTERVFRVSRSDLKEVENSRLPGGSETMAIMRWKRSSPPAR